ncbi:hypothetical protein RFI_26051 [Reticulomyxa filosa]|uniref:RING-type domain-containing protein n=1 Tax=Reticulomyxa filosa TaxID=46433 RepID=X6ME60_RETFI|nr:hypothetical protein RFI_26051 [Reticulomyxa filosa]|eukprot:ETO11325.1 hypothetical protein RFI_26051 [Reticulomyxa filosa]
MNDQIQVFVKLDMNNRGTATITLKKNATVADLIAKIKDKEGADDVRLNFRGKPLVETDQRGRLILPKLNQKRELEPIRILFFLMDKKRLDWGICVCVCVWCFHKENCKIFVGAVDICENTGLFKAKFPCNHVVCPECLFTHFQKSIDVNGRTSIPCPYTCSQSLDIDAVFEVAGLTEDEKQHFEYQLGKNACGNSICPNGNCNMFVFDDGIKDNRVQCPKCKSGWFCKQCKQQWKTENNEQVCGNIECGSTAQWIEILTNCNSKTLDVVDGVTPVARLCPNCQRVLS